VVDTGVLVSAFAFGGIPEKAVRKAFVEAEICVSPPLLEEYRKVPLALEFQGKINHDQLKSLLSGIASFVVAAKIVNPRNNITICRDPGDNMLLECSFAAKAEILITSDKDLLSLQNLPFDLAILTPRRFLEEK
jgi:putative PIN family toxin of toxin-antitoxin system